LRRAEAVRDEAAAEVERTRDHAAAAERQVSELAESRAAYAGIDIDERKQAEERMRHENLALREDIDRSSMFEEIVGRT
jgi:hypothetical protein